MKRRLLAGLVALCVAFALAACSGSKPKDMQGTEPATISSGLQTVSGQEENELPIIPDGEPVESGAAGGTQSASAQQAAKGQSGSGQVTAGQATASQAAAKQSTAGGQVTSKAAAPQGRSSAKTTAKGAAGGKTTAKPATGNYVQIDEDGNVIHLEENELPILPG